MAPRYNTVISPFFTRTSVKKKKKKKKRNNERSRGNSSFRILLNARTLRDTLITFM